VRSGKYKKSRREGWKRKEELKKGGGPGGTPFPSVREHSISRRKKVVGVRGRGRQWALQRETV